jgi:peptide/nickel transport system substrate-binding protein
MAFRFTSSRAIIGAWLVACTPASSPQRSATIVYASGADLQSINPLVTVHPLAKAVQKHVLFTTLATYDSVFNAVPRLASWQWNDDRASLTLRLRDDVFWHDGVRTTARDVAWTLEMARHPAVAYPRARDLAAVRSVDVRDSLTVRLQFERGQPTFPDVLTDLAILPSHRFQGVPPDEIRTAPFNRAPVGNGPFRFVRYRPNQRWVFERVEEFPSALGAPAFERFAVVVVNEPATKLAALTSGELDFAGISPWHAEFVAEDPRLRIIDYPFLFVYGLIYNLRRAPFDDPVIRRALTMALDRRLIVDAYLYGFGTVAHGPVAPEHPWHAEVRGVTHDPDSAGALLESRGWVRGAGGIRRNDGRRLAFTLLTVGSSDAPLEQMMQAQLRAVGVDVTLRQLELSTFLSVAQGEARDFEALVMGIAGDLSLGYVGALFQGDGGPLAYAGYRSAPFDDAVRRAALATTEAGLVEAWHDAQRALAADHPVSWLYHARGLQGAARRVEGAGPDLRGELSDISRWRVRP